jgi:hypothetical protein
MLSSLALGLQMGLTTALPMPAAIVALDRTPQAELDHYTRRIEQDGGWWLEIEDKLLIAAPIARYAELVQGRHVVADLGFLRPDDLALQSRACGIDAHERHPAIAEAGRFALVRIDANALPYRAPDLSEWKPVVPNQVLARDENARGRVAMAKRAVDPDVQLRVDAFDAAQWFSDVTTLAGFDRSSYGGGIDQARDWLTAQFQGLGLSVSTPSFTFGSTTVENVVATLAGTAYPTERVLIGGHYDSRQQAGSNPANTPGAEDNATGCAGVLAAARVFAQYRPQRTMVFVCFAGEEQGLHGSDAYVDALQAAGEDDDVDLAVVMDMIGYSGDTDLDVLLESSSAMAGVFPDFMSAAATYAPELRVVSSTNYWGSDHVPFIDAGIPSLLTIENDYGSYPHYHKTTDLPANITRALEMGGGILKMNIAVLAEAAGFETPVFRDGFE